jgi:ribosome-interacting GTPase 1
MPLAGMMPFEDIFIQLVDTPPVTAEIIPAGLSGVLRSTDILLVMVDAASDDCLEQLEFCLNYLEEKKIVRENAAPGVRGVSPGKVMVLAVKADLPQSTENMQIMKELGPAGIELHPVSTKTGQGLEVLREKIFQKLGVIRVYTKIPGREPDLKRPFILKRGSTVLELAEVIHRDLPKLMKNARVWGSAKYEGQSVMRDYTLHDRDVVEISQ